MGYKTKFVQDLCSIRTDIYEEVIQFTINPNVFLQNVQNLRKSSLEALVYVLLMKQRGKLPGTMLEERQLSLKDIISIINMNYLQLQSDSDTFRWILSALTLMVLNGKDIDFIRKQLESFVATFDSEWHELPLYYDVLRTFLILGKENTELISIVDTLNGEKMIRRLSCDSSMIRMKALACLQTMVEFDSTLFHKWLLLVQDPKVVMENKIFMLYQLIETLVRKNNQNAELVRTLQCDQIWSIIIDSLTLSDAVCRKEALSTIQYAISYAKHSDHDVVGQYFNWSRDRTQSERLTNAWQSFITIAEALNESQAHLILPALELLEKVKPLHMIWKNTLLRMIFRHENVRVINFGLEHYIKDRSFDGTEVNLEKQFLETFNRSATFDNTADKVVSLSSYYSTPEALSFLLNTIPEISWNSIPYYCISIVIHDRVSAQDAGKEGLVLPLKSLTNCVKMCQKVKNISLRYITSMLILKTISRVATRSKKTEISKLLLITVNEVEILSKVFSISLENFQDESGLTFYDAITQEASEIYLPKVSVKDTFFIKELLVRRILRADLQEQQRQLEKLAHCNLPVYMKILNLLPEIPPSCMDEIAKASSFATGIITKAIDTSIPIKPDIFEMLREICLLLRANEESKRFDAYNELLSFMYKHVSSRLVCFDYNQTAAVQTIQMTHFLLSSANDKDLGRLFFKSVSINDLSDNFQRFQSMTTPSIDEVYTMVAGIYLYYCLARPEHEPSFSSLNDWSKLLSLLDVGNVDVLTLVIEILHTDKTLLSDEYRMKVADRCYEEILSYRKSDHFMKLIKRFIEMLLQPYIRMAESVDRESATIHGRVSEYVAMFLEQASTIYGLANIVFETVFQLPVEIILNWGSFGKVLLQGMIFGDVQKRDQKVENEIIEQSGLEVGFKHHPRYIGQADARVRVLCVQYLYKIAKAPDQPDAALFLLKLERMLIERFAQITKAKERYYADSITHRQKLRIVQALCVVLKLTGSKPYPLLEVMLYETNQPNINYLIELIVADSSIDTLTIANSLRNEKVKVSGIQSVFVILWLRCCQTNSLDEQYIYLLLPWTMAQNFSTRLYAQITIKKLIAKFSTQPIDAGPFREIYAAVNSYLRQGNVERNIEKCMKDFRFNSVFDYANLLTLENVFHNIPRVSAAPVEDVVGTATLKDCYQTLGLAESNLGQALEFDELRAEKRVNCFLAESFGGADFVQRKIVPLKNLEPAQDMLLGLPEHLCAKKMDSPEGLIVVASLVNRAPNLGGLARTCEIFAVKQFVINSLQDIDNKEFQALSMTAEKWLNVGELKTHKIIEYLEEMKSKGYAIVGAEQTTGSKPIEQMQFPKKCILVLGHEKNGLPAEIIRHLDLIGEIPQFGVVRSLNVHVTGAIFMWEYAKQHLVKTLA